MLLIALLQERRVMLMKRVMIVDDAVFMRISLRTILENNGFEVVGEAENGAVATKLYSDLYPDVVTMDITMPEMDGIQALKAIRSQDCNAKIVMISALGQESYVKEAIMLGAKGFIVKPWKEEYVIQTLSKL
jgi:two-component system, chemotaxis family, chemotaxis protein CheY